MASCYWIPSVRNKNNDLVESKLYKELTFLTRDRKLTEDVYWATKTDVFNEYYSGLAKDENGEYLIKDLITKTGFDTYVGIANIERQAGAGESISSYYDGLVKAEEKNKTNPFSEGYAVVPLGDRLGVHKGINSETVLKERRYHEFLEKKLKEWGVSVGVLTEAEERAGLNGLTDFSRARRTLDGLVEIIRIAKGEKGEGALSEEFAHLALEMLDVPLKSRLYASITEEKAREILGEQYDQYLEKYGDFETVQKEVAGKMLSKALENNFENTTQIQKGLLQRLVDYFKKFFSKFDHFSLMRGRTEIESNFNKLAKEILNGGLKSEMSLVNISATKALAQLDNTISLESTLREAVEKAIETEQKRLLIYKSDMTFAGKQRNKIARLKEAAASDATLLEGFMEYVGYAHKDLHSLVERMKNLNGATLEEEAKLLRTIRDYAASYDDTLSYARRILFRFNLESEVSEPLDALVKSMESSSNYIKDLWKEESKSILKRLVQPIMGDELIVPFGKHAGTVYSLDKLLEEVSEDIGLLERWALPMNVSTDVILQSIDYAVKDRLYQSRKMAIDFERRILEAQNKLGKDESTDFMFERDSEGNLTGKYVRKYNYTAYDKARSAFAKELAERFNISENANPKETLDRKDRRAYYQAWRNWSSHNQVVTEDGRVPADKYLNPAFSNLTAKQMEYYNTFMELKTEMEQLLPEGMTNTYNIVKVRAKAGESLQKGNIKGYVKEKLSDFALVTGEDSERLGVENALTDFSGNIYRYLPMHYIKTAKGENMNSMSTNATSSLILYGNAVARYNQLDQIANTLEVSYMALKARDVGKTKNGLSLKSMFRNEKGEEEGATVYKEDGSKELVKRLRDYLDKALYQEGVQDYKREFGGKVYSLKKANDALMSYTALKGMGLNFASQFANIMNGVSQNLIESIWAKEKMTMADIGKANQIYFKNLGDILKYKETGQTSNKLAMLLRLVDANQDWTESVSEKYSGTTQMILKHLNSSLLTIGQGLGDHYLKHLTAIAFLNNKKLKLNGEEVDVLDAIEEYYIDENDKGKGMGIRFKEGVTDSLDAKVDFDSYFSNMSQQMLKLNQRMYGVYNTIDKPALSKYIVGSWLLTFRNWLPRMVHARIAKTHYNVAEKEWDQGYYNSYIYAIKELYKVKKDIEFLDAVKVLLGSQKKAEELGFDMKVINNIRRTLTDMGLVAFFTILSMMLSHLYGLDEEDKKKRKQNIAKMSQFDKYLLYFVTRNEIELGSTSPFALKIASEQTKQIVTNSFTPASTGMDIINNMFQLVYVHDIDGFHFGTDSKVWGKDKRFKEGQTPFWKYSKASTAATRLMFPWVDNTSRMDDPLEQAKALLIYRR